MGESQFVGPQSRLPGEEKNASTNFFQETCEYVIRDVHNTRKEAVVQKMDK
jgi:hypothetical protein